MSDPDIPVEIIRAPEAGADGDADDRPEVEPASRVDVLVKDGLYPTARLEDGRYVAWWFDTDAPAPSDPATSEWIVAPTRYLAAVTLRELWEDPAAFDSLVEGNASITES